MFRAKRIPQKTHSTLFHLFFGVLLNLLSVAHGFCFTDVVTYVHPEHTLMARIEVPVGEGPFPVVMAIHGGGFLFGDRTAFGADFIAHFTDLGYAYIAIEYRLPQEGGAHPEAIKDCMHNLHWLIDHADEYDFDTDLIVIQGSSAGSYLAMMLGLTAGLPDFQPDFGPYQGMTAQVQAVISSAGIYDWAAISTVHGGPYIGDYREDPSASPVNRAGDSACSSFLLLGGEADTGWSPPEVAQAMHDTLLAEGIYSELHLKPGEGHPALYNSTCGYCVWAFARIDPFLVSRVASPTGIGSASVPGSFRILSTSPNPFNPAVLIRYELPGADRVSLRVFDVSGRLVKVLVSASESAGVKEVTWDGRNSYGRDVSSGVYYTHLEAGGETRTRQITLLR